MWLQLLQRSLHLSHKLPHGPKGPSRQGSLSEGLDPALDIRLQVGTLVKSYQASLQELMTQLLVHWKVTRTSCLANECPVLNQDCAMFMHAGRLVRPRLPSHSRVAPSAALIYVASLAWYWHAPEMVLAS